MRRAVFISGRGSNLSSLLSEGGEFPVHLVVSNNKTAAGLGRARRQGVSVKVLPELGQKGRPEVWLQLAQELNRRGYSQILLLGFMRILPPSFIETFRGEIINLHPSLLPLYKGLNALERSFQEGAPMGVTVHLVNELLDSGEIIRQRVLKIPKSAVRHSLTSPECHFLISLLEQRTVLSALRQRRLCGR